MIELGSNRYGKAAIRLVRIARGPGGDRVRDLTVAIALEGDFDAAHTDGDNANVIATDTMKNTAYVFAKDHLDGSIEAYGRALAEHFLAEPQVDVATVNVRAHHWGAIDVAGTPAPDAFVRGGEGTRVATVSASLGSVFVEAGVEDLIVMKTGRSAFSGFPRDRYTTLPETDDRILATSLVATWRHSSTDVDWNASYDAVLDQVLNTFAGTYSRALQESLYAMGTAVTRSSAVTASAT